METVSRLTDFRRQIAENPNLGAFVRHLPPWGRNRADIVNGKARSAMTRQQNHGIPPMRPSLLARIYPDG